jgi:hypothetical protein
MSLINDALKRASKTDRGRQRPPPEQPIATLKPAVKQSGFPPLLAVAAVFVLALAGLFFWQWWHASHRSASGKKAPFAAAAPRAEPPPGVTETVPSAKPAEAAAAQTSDAPDQAKPAEAAWPAELKLGGIIFNKTNPMAMINGKTVAVNDLIEGIRVAKIEPDRVSLEWNGRVKELMMK